VDNAIVEMDANEPPIGDGSAKAYVDVIKRAGVSAQEAPRKFFHVREPMHIETKRAQCSCCCRTTTACGFRAPKPGQTIVSRIHSTDIVPELFEREIAPARTFVYYEEVESLIEKNLIKGGSRKMRESCAATPQSWSKEPLRFRTNSSGIKFLDIVGDLAAGRLSDSWVISFGGQTRQRGDGQN